VDILANGGEEESFRRGRDFVKAIFLWNSPDYTAKSLRQDECIHILPGGTHSNAVMARALELVNESEMD